MYFCLNVVTESLGYPAAVLLRGLESTANTKLDGPGKICRYLTIDKSLNHEDLVKSRQLWFEDRYSSLAGDALKATPRIGIDYAGQYKDKPWRFVLKSKLP